MISLRTLNANLKHKNYITEISSVWQKKYDPQISYRPNIFIYLNRVDVICVNISLPFNVCNYRPLRE